MKFNQKLIELRKKQGLSQEELGYKLNVTRQTVSKWELGSTTPEMDKLVEISKIFNVSVDYLINDAEEPINNVIEDQTIKKENTGTGKTVVKVLLIILAIFIIGGIIFTIIGLTLFNKIGNEALNMFESTSNYILQDSDMIDTMDTSDEGNFFKRIFKVFTNFFNNTNEIIEEANTQIDEMGKQSFNQSLEVFSGRNQKGVVIKNSIINTIIFNAEYENREITVKYNDIETKDLEEIKDLKTNIDDSKTYKVSYEYDEEGYICKVLIEDVAEEEDVDVEGTEPKGNTTVENNYTSTTTTTINNGTKVHTTTSSSSTTTTTSSSSSSSSTSSSTSSSSSSSNNSSSNIKNQMQQNMDKAQQMQQQMQQNFESNKNKAQQMQQQMKDMMQNH